MAKSLVKTKGGDNLKKLLKDLNGLTMKANVVAIGLPSDSNPYPDGTSIIMVGTVNEFGSPNMGIPERSFLRTGTIVAEKVISQTIAKPLAKKVLNGSIEPKKALHIMGQIAQSSVQQKITEMSDPTNAAMTLAMKYPKTSPLINTGHLRQSIRYKVGDSSDFN